MSRPILITMGEPSGVGPEIAVKAWAALGGKIGRRALRFVGDAGVLQAAASLAGIDADAVAKNISDPGKPVRAVPGKPAPANAPAVIAAIEDGAARVRRGDAAALVTAPIHKAILMQAGFGFAGHTEFLGHLTGAKRAVMMLAGPDLRVVPLTVHVPLAEVPGLLSTPAIVETAEIVLASLKSDFAVAAPRLAIAGLNPHAGEESALGREDRDIVAPAVCALTAKGYAVTGPHPADTLFHAQARARYDAALCMYHDQALIPIKTLSFWDAVNVTLGLPIVRTSPDHGTALDIAGRGIADPRSMIAAIEMAAAIADARGL